MQLAEPAKNLEGDKPRDPNPPTGQGLVLASSEPQAPEQNVTETSITHSLDAAESALCAEDLRSLQAHRAELTQARAELDRARQELERARSELDRQRESLDVERARASDRIAREAAEVERQQAELQVAQAELAAEQEALLARGVPASMLDGEQESEMDDEQSFPRSSELGRSMTEQSPAASTFETDEEEEEPQPPRGTPQRGSANQSTESHEDLSIEEYMANLLKRMRGGAASDSTVSHEPKRAKRRPEPHPVIEQPKPAAAEPVAATTPVIEKPVTKLEPTRRVMPIETGDLNAMRELANTQARAAIDLHGRKRMIKSVAVKFAVSAAFLVGTFVVLNMTDNKAIQTGAMTGLVASIYWLFGGALAAQRLQNEPNFLATLRAERAAAKKNVQ